MEVVLFLLLRMGGKVWGFPRVGTMVIQLLGEGFLAVAVEPFHVPELVCPEGIAHQMFLLSPTLELADGHLFYTCRWVFQDGSETCPIKMVRNWESSEFAKGGVEVDKFCKRICTSAVSFGRGIPKDEGDAGIDLVVRLFTPTIVFAEFEAEVASEGDNCIVF